MISPTETVARSHHLVLLAALLLNYRHRNPVRCNYQAAAPFLQSPELLCFASNLVLKKMTIRYH